MTEVENISEGITGAKLELYATGSHTSNFGPDGDLDKPNGVKTVFEAPYSWDQTSVTWEKYGDGYEQSDGVMAPVGDLLEVNTNTEFGVWEQFDVTSAVEKMINNPAENNGFMVVFESNGWDRYATEYASSENSDKTIRPKLVITYDDQTSLVGKTAISEKEMELTIHNGHLILNVQTSDVQLDLFSLSGRKIMNTQHIHMGKNSIALPSTMSKGVYLVRILGSEVNMMQLIVVE